MKENCNVCFFNPKNYRKYGDYTNDSKQFIFDITNCNIGDDKIKCENWVLDADYSDVIQEFAKSRNLDSIGTYVVPS